MSSHMIKGYRIIFSDGESNWRYTGESKTWSVEAKRTYLEHLEEGRFPHTIDEIKKMAHVYYRPPGMGFEGDSRGYEYKQRGFTLW